MIYQITKKHYHTAFKLRRIIQNINDSFVINPNIATGFDIVHKRDNINYIFSVDDEEIKYQTEHDESMKDLLFYYQNDGTVILKIILKTLEMYSYFSDEMNKPINDFLQKYKNNHEFTKI